MLLAARGDAPVLVIAAQMRQGGRRGSTAEGRSMKKLLMLGAAVAALATPTGVSASTITQVMRGLDNAKGLAFGPEGALYVAEAGRGGPGSGLCWTSPRPDLGFRCYGATGAISRYWHGTQERIVTGLPSPGRPQGLSTSRSRDAAACT